jgi:4-hydroxybenzoate polyprenyltransferase
MLVRDYLQLFRIPGVVTAISNILFGFFAIRISETAWLSLPLLIACSGSLYLAGMILNDFFDYKTDKTERPFRPLPSGKISKNKALMLGVFFITSANIWSFFVSTQSLFLSIIMSGLIFFYNKGAKKIIPLGISILCLIRFLNILLGTSIETITTQSLLLPIPLAILVAGISTLSSVETKSATKQVILFNSITLAATVLVMLTIFYERLGGVLLTFLTIFVISTVLPTVMLKGKTSLSVQKIVTFQLLSIIILDATMTVMFVEVFYGLVIISLYLPAFFLGKKIYVT